MQTHTELTAMAERALALINAEIEQREGEIADLRAKYAALAPLVGAKNGNGLVGAKNGNGHINGRMDWVSRLAEMPPRFTASDLAPHWPSRSVTLARWHKRGRIRRIGRGVYEKVSA